MASSSQQSQQERDDAAKPNIDPSAPRERGSAPVYLTRPTAPISRTTPLFTTRNLPENRPFGTSSTSRLPVRPDTSDGGKKLDAGNDGIAESRHRFTLSAGATRTLTGAFQAAGDIMRDEDKGKKFYGGSDDDRDETGPHVYQPAKARPAPRTPFRKPTPLYRGGGPTVPGVNDKLESPEDRAKKRADEARAKAREERLQSVLRKASPPRGLAEAYHRVAEEEELAAVTSPVDEKGEGDTYHFNSPSRQPDLDQIRVERLRNSAPPIVMKNLSRPSSALDNTRKPEEVDPGKAARDEARVQRLLNSDNPITLHKSPPRSVEKALARDAVPEFGYDKDNNTIQSVQSGISGISSVVGDDTDDSFGRKLFDYAKDKHRLEIALGGDAKAFSKAKVGERARLDAEKDINDIPTPPVQPPRDWGRKGRTGIEWMERIVGVQGKIGMIMGPDGQLMEPPTPTEDTPIPTIEEGDSTVLAPHLATKNNSLEEIAQREEESRKEQVRKSPSPVQPPLLVQTRNPLLDTIREREIESLKDKAVTTNRLGEIKQRASMENMRPRSPAEDKPELRIRSRRSSTQSNSSLSDRLRKKSSVAEHLGNDKATTTTPPKDQDEAQALKKPASEFPAYIDEGEHIADSPITIFRAPSTYGQENGDGSKPHHRRRSSAGSRKSDIDGKDPIVVLRRLSRASSTSPNHSLSMDEIEENDGNDEMDAAKRKEETPELKPEVGDDSTTPKPYKDAFDDIVKKDRTNTERKDHHPTPVVNPGGWVDTPAPSSRASEPTSPPADYDVDKEISALGLRDFIRGPSSSPLYTRSGGLKDRPSKEAEYPRQRRPHQKSQHVKEEPTVPKAQPAAEIARSDQSDSELDFNPDDADQTYAAIPSNDPPALEFTNIHRGPGRPLTKTERTDQQDILVVEHLNERLRSLHVQVAEAKEGIALIEGKMAGSDYTLPASGPLSWKQRPYEIKNDGNFWTVTIKIPGKGFAKSVYYDRKWRWLRVLVYMWCFFWVYAAVELYTYLYTLPPLYVDDSGWDVKRFGPAGIRETCYPHPWTTLLQLTRPFSWFYLNVLGLPPPGRAPDDFDQSPWKGSFLRRVMEWNWNLWVLDCVPSVHDRGDLYYTWTLIMRALNYNA